MPGLVRSRIPCGHPARSDLWRVFDLKEVSPQRTASGSLNLFPPVLELLLEEEGSDVSTSRVKSAYWAPTGSIVGRTPLAWRRRGCQILRRMPATSGRNDVVCGHLEQKLLTSAPEEGESHHGRGQVERVPASSSTARRDGWLAPPPSSRSNRYMSEISTNQEDRLNGLIVDHGNRRARLSWRCTSMRTARSRHSTSRSPRGHRRSRCRDGIAGVERLELPEPPLTGCQGSLARLTLPLADEPSSTFRFSSVERSENVLAHR